MDEEEACETHKKVKRKTNAESVSATMPANVSLDTEEDMLEPAMSVLRKMFNAEAKSWKHENEKLQAKVLCLTNVKEEVQEQVHKKGELVRSLQAEN